MLRTFGTELRRIALVRDFSPKEPVHPVKTWLMLDPSDNEGYLDVSGSLPESSYQKIACTFLGYPTLRQTYTYDCGASVISTLMQFYGFDLREENALKRLGTSKSGTSIVSMVNFLKKNGFQVTARSSSIDEVKGWVGSGIPVILSIQAWPDTKKEGWQDTDRNGHYVTAIGYTDQHIICSDPSSVYDSYLSNDELQRRWHDKDADGREYRSFAIVASGMPPVYEHNRIMPMG